MWDSVLTNAPFLVAGILIIIALTLQFMAAAIQADQPRRRREFNMSLAYIAICFAAAWFLQVNPEDGARVTLAIIMAIGGALLIWWHFHPKNEAGFRARLGWI